MSNNNITEQLFRAIEIINEQQLSNIAFDTTLICTVVDNSDAHNGRYTVTDGSVRFDAYTEVTTYRVDDSVRVLVPKGDFKEKKFIQGKYVSDNDAVPITYTSPLSSVLEMTDNLIADGAWGIKANASGSATTEVEIWHTNFENANFLDIQNNSIFDTIYLKGDFETYFPKCHFTKGSYGLKLSFKCVTDLDSGQGTLYHAYFDSSEFFGNPFSFLIPAHQEKKFELSKWPGTIYDITLSLYQKGNFTYIDDSGNEVTYVPNAQASNNIVVKNVCLGLGAEITKIEDDTLKIYTADALNFDSSASSDNVSQNDKTIGLLWYNKDEMGNYVGFSDGIADVDYSEDAYIEVSSTNTRLLTQKNAKVPDDELSLTIAADIADVKKIVVELNKLLGTDYVALLRGYQQATAGMFDSKPAQKESLETLISPNSVNNSLGKLYLDIESHTKLLYQFIEKGLLEGAKRQSGLSYSKVTIPTYGDNQTPSVINFSSINARITNIKNIIDGVFNAGLELIEAGFESYRDSHLSYKSRCDKMHAKLAQLTDKLTGTVWYNNTYSLDGYLTFIQSTLTDSSVSYIFDPCEAVDYSDYHNKYCVYWYRYDKGAPQAADKFLPAGWVRLSNNTNVGLPNQTNVGDDGKTYYAKRADATCGFIHYTCNRPVETERIKAIVFYNHQMFISNEIEFKNTATLVDESAIDANGALSIEHSTNSLKDYQFYGIGNFLTNPAEAQRMRLIRAHFDGEAGGDEQLKGASIFWYVPQNSTMISISDRDYDGGVSCEGVTLSSFYRDDVAIYASATALNNDYAQSKASAKRKYLVGPIDGKYEFYKFDSRETDPTTKFKPTGVKTAGTAALQAAADAKPGYVCFYKQIGDGDDYINDTYLPYHISNYYSPTSNQNGIYCKVKKGDSTFESEIFFTFTTFGNSGTDYTLAVVPDPSQPMVLPNKGMRVRVSLRDANGEEMAMSYSTDASSDVTFSLEGNAANQYNVTPINTTIYRDSNGVADDSTKISSIDFYINKKDGQVLFPGRRYCAILKVEVKKQLPNYGTGKTTLTTYFPIPFAANENYYIEGASTVVYDGSGGEPQYYKEPYKLFSLTNNAEISGVTWSIYGSDEGYSNSNTTSAPTLSANNTLVPCTFYIDGATHEYAVVAFKTINGVSQVQWVQPLYILQNRYGLPMINAWDGSFKIDEANGTIMSTMVGAGKKMNNAFYGVLMGDIAAGTNTNAFGNKSGIGLYGFHNGAQSFAFNIDGTGFIGKSGRGRIIFDGENGKIYSNAWLNSKNGMCLDFDDGKFEINHHTNRSPTNAYVVLDQNGGTTGYFKIDIGKKDAPGTSYPLIFMGNNNYYLRSYNYTEGEYSTVDGTPNTGGAGTYFNLQTGELDSYNLKITSKNLYLDSSDGTTHPYFIIKDDAGKNLFYASSDKFYLQTSNFEADTSGMKIDLKTGSIQSYDFDLKGVSGTSESASQSSIRITSTGSSTKPFFRVWTRDKDTGSTGISLVDITNNTFKLQSKNWEADEAGMQIDLFEGKITSFGNFRFLAQDGNDSVEFSSAGSTSSPYLQITTDVDGTKKTLMSISKGAYYFQTADYSSTNKTGMQLNFKTGKLTSYGNFTLTAQNTTKNDDNTYQFVKLTSTTDDNPFNVNNKFVINWDGSFWSGGTSSSPYFKVNNTGVAINKGTLIINSNGSSTSTAKTIDINKGVFYVRQDGYMYAKKGNIAGWQINSDSLMSEGGGVFLSPTGLTTITTEDGDQDVTTPIVFKAGDNFLVHSTGHLQCLSGELGPWLLDDTGLYQKSGTKITHYLGDGISAIQPGTTTTNKTAILKCGDDFLVDNTGKLYATGAVLDTLKITGTTYFNNKSTDGSNTTGVYMYSKEIWIGLGAKYSEIWLDGDTWVTGSMDIDADLTLGGDINIEGTLKVGGTEVVSASGDAFECTIDGSGLFGGSYTLVFSNGLLISATKN